MSQRFERVRAMKKNLRVMRQPVLLLTAAGVLMMMTISCRYRPRWTPESVRPPVSLENALANARLAAGDERSALPADIPTTVPLSRDGAILMVLARNRSLRVQQFGPRIAETRIPEARAQFDPRLTATASYGRDTVPVLVSDPEDPLAEPTLEGSSSRRTAGSATLSEFLPTGTEVFLSGGMTRNRSGASEPSYLGTWSAEVNQALLRGVGPAVNLVSLRQARNSAAVSQHELRGFIMDLVQQVEDAYWDLQLAKETVAIREFSVELAREQLLLNEDFIKAEKLARGAQYSAQSALSNRQVELVDARAAVRTRTIELIRLLNPENSAQWALKIDTTDAAQVAEVELDPDVSCELAKVYRPELAQSRLDLANRDLAIVQTRNGLLPRLDAFASYGRISSGNSFSDAKEYLDDSDFDNYQVGVTFDMSPINRAERARYRRAKFERESSEAALSNLEQVIEAEVRNAVIEAQRQAERIPATQETLKSRQEELRVEEGRFRVGISTNIDVLLIQQALIQAQLDEVTARVRYIQALTALYNREGTLLDRRGVAADVNWESVK